MPSTEGNVESKGEIRQLNKRDVSRPGIFCSCVALEEVVLIGVRSRRPHHRHSYAFVERLSVSRRKQKDPENIEDSQAQEIGKRKSGKCFNGSCCFVTLIAVPRTTR